MAVARIIDVQVTSTGRIPTTIHLQMPPSAAVSASAKLSSRDIPRGPENMPDDMQEVGCARPSKGYKKVGRNGHHHAAITESYNNHSFQSQYSSLCAGH